MISQRLKENKENMCGPQRKYVGALKKVKKKKSDRKVQELWFLALRFSGWKDSDPENIHGLCVCVWEGEDRLCQGIAVAPARPRHCRHTIGHQHRSDKPSHHITHGHVAHRAPDTAVASHLHVILNHRDILLRRTEGSADSGAIPCSMQ